MWINQARQTRQGGFTVDWSIATPCLVRTSWNGGLPVRCGPFLAEIRQRILADPSHPSRAEIGMTRSNRGKYSSESSQGQAGSAAWLVAVDQDPLGGAIEILILAAPQGPQEPGQPKRSEEQGHRYEVGERRHEDCASAPMSERLSCRASCTDAFDTKPCRRSALPMTRRDEADIATAAISGVTCPRMAIGTATPL